MMYMYMYACARARGSAIEVKYLANIVRVYNCIQAQLECLGDSYSDCVANGKQLLESKCES